MSETGGPARPRQLTMAGAFLIGGSVLLVLSVFDTFTGLQSVETRAEVTRLLSSPAGKGLGLGVDDVLTLMRVGLMVAAACGAASAVLGFYVLQRNRAARLAVSLLAVPIMLTAPLTGGLVGVLVAVAVLMLWSGQARDWFAGRPVRELQPRSRRQPPAAPQDRQDPHQDDRTGSSDPAGSSPSTWSTAGSSTEPEATTGFGERPVQLPDAHDTTWSSPTYGQAQDQVREPVGGPVPVAVKVACFLTWAFAGTVALLYAGLLVGLVAAQDQIVRVVVATPEWQRADLQQDVLVPALWVGCLLFLSWAFGACLLAVFTWRRRNWARWLLMVSAGIALVLGVFALPVGVVHQLAALLTIIALAGPTARAWFSGRPPAPNPNRPPPAGSQRWAAPDPASRTDGQEPQQAPDEHPSRAGGKPPVW